MFGTKAQETVQYVARVGGCSRGNENELFIVGQLRPELVQPVVNVMFEVLEYAGVFALQMRLVVVYDDPFLRRNEVQHRSGIFLQKGGNDKVGVAVQVLANEVFKELEVVVVVVFIYNCYII